MFVHSYFSDSGVYLSTPLTDTSVGSASKSYPLQSTYLDILEHPIKTEAGVSIVEEEPYLFEEG